jgi:endoglucanase
LVSNGTFDLDLGSWWSAVEWVGAATFPVINGEVALNITNGSNEEWHVMLGQNDIPIVKDQVYCLKLDARASVAFNLKLNVQQHGGAHTGYYSSTSVLGMAMKSFIYEFSSSQSDAAAQVQFNMGKQGTGTIWIDNFELRKKTQSSCQFASPTL